MIANGSLTPQTLVFMKGMSGWLPAEQVPKVKELFSDQISVPDVPPVPWANSNESESAPSSSTVVEENVLSPRLNRLISAAVADGEISDMERQVLIRNAQEEGVAMDEFVMILEARLYEQREALIARQKELEHKHQMEKASAQAAATKAAAAMASPKDNKNNFLKCPRCGAPIKALATCCPDCGYEYQNNGNNLTSSSSERLAKLLHEVDQKKGLLAAFNNESQKISIIGNFPVPNSKADILDLFSSCVTKAKRFNLNGTQLDRAYYKKSQEILIKARVVLKDDQDLLDQINELAKKYKIKA